MKTRILPTFARLRDDYRETRNYSLACGEGWGLRGALGWFRMAVLVLGPAAICNWRGHKLTADACDVESGGESLVCSRCGWNDTVYWS